QAPDNDAARTVVSRRLDPRIDVENEPGHIIVPVEPDHRFGRESAAARAVDRGRRRGCEVVDVVENWDEKFCRGDSTLGDSLEKPGQRRLLAVNQKDTALYRPSRRNPARQLRPIRVAGIFIELANARRHLDLFTLNTNHFDAIDEKSSQRATRLEARQQHRSVCVPQPTLQMVPDTAGIAHAARRDDDVKSGDLGY